MFQLGEWFGSSTGGVVEVFFSNVIAEKCFRVCGYHKPLKQGGKGSRLFGERRGGFVPNAQCPKLPSQKVLESARWLPFLVWFPASGPREGVRGGGGSCATPGSNHCVNCLKEQSGMWGIDKIRISCLANTVYGYNIDGYKYFTRSLDLFWVAAWCSRSRWSVRSCWGLGRVARPGRLGRAGPLQALGWWDEGEGWLDCLARLSLSPQRLL